MILDSEIVIKDCEVPQKLKNKPVIIYGAGMDGLTFYHRYHELADIKFFMDNHKENHTICGKHVYSLKDGLSVAGNDAIIVICSRRYARNLTDSLQKEKLSAGRLYLVWDIYYGRSVCGFMRHNRNVWSHAKKKETDNQIIIPLESGHDGSAVLYSYIAGYLADTYDAGIYAFIRQGGTEYESCIFPSDIDIYRSFNMKEVIDISLSLEQKNKAGELYRRILENIRSVDDWHKICVGDDPWGISIVRDYLRMYPLSFDPVSHEFCLCLWNAVKKIVFWNDYVQTHPVKCVVLWDGVHNESYLRDVAVRHGIPAYIIHQTGMQKAELNFNFGTGHMYLKQFYHQLTRQEQERGIRWAKKMCERILEGAGGAEIPYRGKDWVSVFSYQRQKLLACNNGKIKVLVCPHIFDEDAWNEGWQICSNNYLSWLLFLGEMSELTDYEWYIKMHPDEGVRGERLIKEFVKKYSGITLLAADVSPYDLKEAGIRFVLTIAGSVGHEYPLMGIHVINAGNNPHVAFNFNHHPKNPEEYKHMILNLDKITEAPDTEELYQFFCVYYLYYQKNDLRDELDRVFSISSWYGDESGDAQGLTDYRYDNYMKLYTDDFAENIKREIPGLFRLADSRRADVFYKKPEQTIKELLERVETG